MTELFHLAKEVQWKLWTSWPGSGRIIQHTYACRWLFITPPVTAAKQMQNYVRYHKHAKLLLPFCELQLIAGWRCSEAPKLN